MVGIKKSQEIIEQLLKEYANCLPAYGEIEMETLFDEKQHRYQLIALGWENKKRIHGCLIHIDIKDNKIWLQHDSTDAEIAKQLIERGIPATQIVLGFHPQQYRKLGDFAEC